MPRKCLLLLLDGLGDRSHPALNGMTPLQAASTPNLDRIAAAGANGLFHAASMGQALPSENAHFTLFGYGLDEFPGRGALEALGAGMDMGSRDVAVLAHLACVRERAGVLYQDRDIVPDVPEDQAAELVRAVERFEHDGIEITFHREKELFGVLRVRGDVSRFVTDTNTMRDGDPMSALTPWRRFENDAPAIRTARALRAYVLFAHRALAAHPVNRAREARGLDPASGVVTQRAGRRGLVEPFRERYGLRGATVSSGIVYKGLAAYLGLTPLDAPRSGDVEADYAAQLALAREALREHDFIHVHTKAPDAAAHTKNPEHKKAVIEALDRAVGVHLDALMADPDLVLALTADHSTPSSGPLVHSGEPVPLAFAGPGVRVDAVARFDEVSAATGALGTVRGLEFMYLVLNYLDRAKLMGIMDTPVDRAFWPGVYEPFRTE
ncbi:alkaline phosphatase family protein [Desulfocurvus sp. DL9XJH121]